MHSFSRYDVLTLLMALFVLFKRSQHLKSSLFLSLSRVGSFVPSCVPLARKSAFSTTKFTRWSCLDQIETQPCTNKSKVGWGSQVGRCMEAAQIAADRQIDCEVQFCFEIQHTCRIIFLIGHGINMFSSNLNSCKCTGH